MEWSWFWSNNCNFQYLRTSGPSMYGHAVPSNTRGPLQVFAGRIRLVWGHCCASYTFITFLSKSICGKFEETFLQLVHDFSPLLVFITSWLNSGDLHISRTGLVGDQTPLYWMWLYLSSVSFMVVININHHLRGVLFSASSSEDPDNGR